MTFEKNTQEHSSAGNFIDVKFFYKLFECLQLEELTFCQYILVVFKDKRCLKDVYMAYLDALRQRDAFYRIPLTGSIRILALTKSRVL
jgi:hypothetical protein